jgi:membrane protein DedA with SNARE-associated domain
VIAALCVLSGLAAGAATNDPHQLPGVFHHLEGTLQHWGYIGVAFFIFFEDFGVPLPGETMLIAAALYAGTGGLNIVAVAVIAFLAAIFGDNVGYAIGRFGGRALLERFGKYVFLTPARLDHAEEFFARHGGKIVIAARFIEGLRQLNGIIAGAAEMHWAKFVVYNAIGAALWVGVWTTLGYVAGDHIETISRYATFVAEGLAVIAIIFIVRTVMRARRNRRTSGASTS